MTFEEELYYDEKGLVALYGEFSAKLQVYVEEMETNIVSLNSIINDLGHHWTSEDYKNFREGMQRGIRSTDNQLQRVEALKKEIDQAKTETAIALEKMRIKYGIE